MNSEFGLIKKVFGLKIDEFFKVFDRRIEEFENKHKEYFQHQMLIDERNSQIKNHYILSWDSHHISFRIVKNSSLPEDMRQELNEIFKDTYKLTIE